MPRRLGPLVAILLVALCSARPASACPHCRVEAREAVYTETFAPTAALLLLPLAVVAALGAGLYLWTPSERHGPDPAP